MIESWEKLIHELEHMAGVINDYDDLLNVDCESWVVLDALELLKDQEQKISVLQRAVEQAQKSDKLLDVFGKKLCKDCPVQRLSISG